MAADPNNFDIGTLLNSALQLYGQNSASNTVQGGLQQSYQAADPWGASGNRAAASTELAQFMKDPSSALTTPGAKEIFKQGTAAVNTSNAANGFTGSGYGASRLQDYGMSKAAELENQRFNQLTTLAGPQAGQLAGADILSNLAGAKATQTLGNTQGSALQALLGQGGNAIQGLFGPGKTLGNLFDGFATSGDMAQLGVEQGLQDVAVNAGWDEELLGGMSSFGGAPGGSILSGTGTGSIFDAGASTGLDSGLWSSMSGADATGLDAISSFSTGSGAAGTTGAGTAAGLGGATLGGVLTGVGAFAGLGMLAGNAVGFFDDDSALSAKYSKENIGQATQQYGRMGPEVLKAIGQSSPNGAPNSKVYEGVQSKDLSSYLTDPRVQTNPKLLKLVQDAVAEENSRIAAEKAMALHLNDLWGEGA